jgi:5-hydroxyisourate hydrolase-like protein (transthyretin family)
MGTRLLATGVTIALGATVLVAPASEASVLVRDATSRLVPPSVQVQLTVDDERLVGGEQTTVTGLLLDAQTGTPVVGEELRLQSRRVGSEGWVESGSAVTDSDGAVEWPGVSSRYSTRYRVVHPLSASYARGASDIRTVVVKPTVTVELARDWVRPAGAVRLAGMVRGSYPDERVVLQRRSDGQWQDVRRATQANTGRFAFRIGGGDSYGPQRYRVVLPAQVDHFGDTSNVAELTTVRVIPYRIETRGDIVVPMKEFRERTAEIYADPRGWSRAHVHFKRVQRGGGFSLVLAEASYVTRFSPTCDRYWSCRVGRYVVINQDRWRWGTPYFRSSGGTLREYRAMVVNHETGHWFGLGHAGCGGRGRPAPVMMQQSKGLHGCEPNGWPLAGEVARAY